MEITARIPPKNIDGLKREVEKVNLKALDLGCEPLTLEISELKREKWHGSSRWIEFHEATITGRLPKIAGWTLVARIDHTGPRNVITSTGLWEGEIDPKWREAAPNCDHCRSQRVRNDTFILVHDNGEWAQVGRDCLSDFAGSDSPFKVLRMFLDLERRIGEFEDWDEHRNSPLIDTKIFLSHASAIITEVGWYSKSAWANNDHTGTPTATRIMANMFPDPRVDEDWLIEITDAAEAEAEAALAWVRDDLAPQNVLSDYEYNLVALTEIDAFDSRRYTGIMASLIPAYRRAHGIDERGEKKEIVSTHQGEVGKRETWDLTLTKRVDMEVDSYGYRWGSSTEMLHIHLFEDEAGNIFVWKTTSVSLTEGESYKVKATVKEHGEYNGTPQTIISRAIAYCKDCGKNVRDSKLHEKVDSIWIEDDPPVEERPSGGHWSRGMNLYAVDGCWHCEAKKFLEERAKEEMEHGKV